jgi:hypothetical protein
MGMDGPNRETAERCTGGARILAAKPAGHGMARAHVLK